MLWQLFARDPGLLHWACTCMELRMWHTSGVAFHAILLGEYLPEDPPVTQCLLDSSFNLSTIAMP